VATLATRFFGDADAGCHPALQAAIITGTMAEKPPMISGVHFEQTPERLKIVLAARRKWPYLLLYSALVLAWLVMMIWGFVFIVQIIRAGADYRFVFTGMILILLLVLYRFGRFLLRQWANYLSNREVLFLNAEEVIVRRPVSIWGNTDVYGLEHASPFYQSGAPPALAFDYGYRHVYFGEALSAEARESLKQYLNQTYFPGKAEPHQA
jgi:hypothetical protein